MSLSKAATDAYVAKNKLAKVTAADLEAPLGEYSPDFEATKQGGNFRCRLPETISSAAILVTLSTYSIDVHTITFFLVPVILGVFISAVVQIVLAVGMYESIVGVDSSALSPTCDSTKPLLMHLCLWFFAIFPLRDFIETIGMLQWLNEMPTAEEHERLKVQRFKDFDEILTRPTTGMPLGERAFYLLVCLVPKALVAVVCLLAGTGAILRAADNYDLVMATVAATFIMEADDMIYKFLVADWLKVQVSGAPLFGVADEGTAEYFWSQYQGYLLPLLAALVGNVLLRYFWCAGALASVASLLVVLGAAGAAALAGVAVVLYKFRVPAAAADPALMV